MRLLFLFSLAVLIVCSNSPVTLIATVSPTLASTATPTATLAPMPTPTPPPGIFVDAAKSLGKVSQFAFGTNHGPWAFLNPEVLPQFKASGITLIRFPGGNWGDENDIEAWQLDSFIALARQINAEPLISVRLRGGSVEKAVALLNYTRQQNYKVHYWSIGNEPSLYKADDKTWDTARFNQEWRQYAQALQAVDPSISLVGPDTHQFTGDAATDPKDAQGRDWLREFLKANGDLVDVVAVHRYPFPKNLNEGPPSAEALFNNTAEWDSIPTNLRAEMRELIGRELPIAITEFNSSWVGTIGGKTSLDSFNNALWLADVLGRLIRQRVDLVAQFTLVSSGQVGGFGLFERFDERPSYYTYQMYKDFGDELVAAQSDTPMLNVYAARTTAALNLVVVNLNDSSSTRPLTLDHFTASGRAQVQLFDEAHKAEKQSDIDPTSFTFPPHSVVRLTVSGR